MIKDNNELSKKRNIFHKLMQTCKRVLIVSRGVVMQDEVAPAITPPVAWTNIIFCRLGVSSPVAPWSKNLLMQPSAIFDIWKCA